MRIVRTTLVGILAVALFASLAALALADPPGNPNGCGQGPAASQYHVPSTPPGDEYGGPPSGCPNGG